jgi:hypothetical protein
MILYKVQILINQYVDSNFLYYKPQAGVKLDGGGYVVRDGHWWYNDRDNFCICCLRKRQRWEVEH